MRWRAGCILDLKASEVITRRKCVWMGQSVVPDRCRAAEAYLLGCHTLHGLMVSMKMRVIMDFECGRLQRLGKLEGVSVGHGVGRRVGRHLTLARIRSSTGVVDA
jgi:hypothetical protein